MFQGAFKVHMHNVELLKYSAGYCGRAHAGLSTGGSAHPQKANNCETEARRASIRFTIYLILLLVNAFKDGRSNPNPMIFLLKTYTKSSVTARDEIPV